MNGWKDVVIRAGCKGEFQQGRELSIDEHLKLRNFLFSWLATFCNGALYTQFCDYEGVLLFLSTPRPKYNLALTK